MQALKQRMAEIRADEAERQLVPAARRKPSIATHRAFVPILAIWGAALGAGSVMVLPRALIIQASMYTGLAGLGAYARYGQAVMAGLALGGLALVIAAAIRGRHTGPRDKDQAEAALSGAVRPIDPISELGSESLDAPIEDRAVEAHEDAPGGDADKPREMGLEEFGALPGRDAVWLADEEASDATENPVAPQSETRGEPSLPVPAPEQDNDAPEPGLSAIAKLRSVPPGDLSLVQMIERFAAALHERQAAEQRNPGQSRRPGRDAALADALRALSVLSEAGFGSSGGEEVEQLHDTTRELHKALGKLQRLSGTG